MPHSHEKPHEHHNQDHSHHHQEHRHEPESAAFADQTLERARLRKMVEHWISHNEDHAKSYRLWADRARQAGCLEPGELLEQISSEVIEQNDKFTKIIQLIDSRKTTADERLR
ncbi:MAG: hypothetical protein P4L43_20195 [Syntrophobacteraceae bacterium]|nr:hypothetical protein [Syntrophobacteraceae bacterium]